MRPDTPYRSTFDWRITMAQGVVALIVGLVLLFAPITSLVLLAVVFGAFALVDGILALAAMFVGPRGTPRWALAVYGVVGILAGLFALAWPGLTVAVLAAFVAVWAIVVGVMRIVAHVQSAESERHWGNLLAGIAAIALGLYVLFSPRGLALLVFGLGIYAIAKGIFLLIAGNRLRRATKRGEVPRPEERRRAA